MKITEQTVQDVAKLAHLSLTQEDVAHYQTQLGKITDFFDLLKAVDLPDALFEEKPVSVEREDVCRPSLEEVDVVRNAPKKTGSSFTVPRIIENN